MLEEIAVKVGIHLKVLLKSEKSDNAFVVAVTRMNDGMTAICRSH